jgi:hypothetical protein
VLRSYVDKLQEDISVSRLRDFVRKSRDRVLDSGIVHFWFKKWVVATLIFLLVLLAGIVLVARSDIDFDTFLNYFALGLLIFVLITLFYGIIAIHDVPYEIAKHRNHPHQDAIHAAGWVSLFTLHALWPFLWIWAMAYQPERGWGFGRGSLNYDNELALLRERVAALEGRVSPETRSAREPSSEMQTEVLIKEKPRA